MSRLPLRLCLLLLIALLNGAGDELLPNPDFTDGTHAWGGSGQVTPDGLQVTLADDWTMVSQDISTPPNQAYLRINLTPDQGTKFRPSDVQIRFDSQRFRNLTNLDVKEFNVVASPDAILAVFYDPATQLAETASLKFQELQPYPFMTQAQQKPSLRTGPHELSTISPPQIVGKKTMYLFFPPGHGAFTIKSVHLQALAERADSSALPTGNILANPDFKDAAHAWLGDGQAGADGLVVNLQDKWTMVSQPCPAHDGPATVALKFQCSADLKMRAYPSDGGSINFDSSTFDHLTNITPHVFKQDVNLPSILAVVYDPATKTIQQAIIRTSMAEEEAAGTDQNRAKQMDSVPANSTLYFFIPPGQGTITFKWVTLAPSTTGYVSSMDKFLPPGRFF